MVALYKVTSNEPETSAETEYEIAKNNLGILEVLYKLYPGKQYTGHVI